MAKEDGISKKMAQLNQLRIEKRLTKGFQIILRRLLFQADIHMHSQIMDFLRGILEKPL